MNISKLTFYPTIIKYIISTLVVLVCNFIVCSFIDKSSWIGFILSGMICVIISFILIYITLLDKEEKIFIKDKAKIIVKKQKNM